MAIYFAPQSLFTAHTAQAYADVADNLLVDAAGADDPMPDRLSTRDQLAMAQVCATLAVRHELAELTGNLTAVLGDQDPDPEDWFRPEPPAPQSDLERLEVMLRSARLRLQDARRLPGWFSLRRAHAARRMRARVELLEELIENLLTDYDPIT